MRTISLTRGYVAFVDDEDFEGASRFRWCAHKKPADLTAYARRKARESRGQQRTVWLHREIVSAPHGVLVDHIDGNGLNCQRANLRLATASQNARNQGKSRRGTSSRWKGVTLHRASGMWQASFKTLGRSHYLGLFEAEDAAARAYDIAARAHFGEFARLNFPEVAT